MTDRRHLFLLGAISLALLLIIYHQALSIPYFGDDFQWFFPHPLDMVMGNFVRRAPYNEWYRPLQTTILASIQFLWGMDTLPIRIIHFVIHVSIGLLIFSALRYWRVGTAAASVAALYFVASQASAYPVAANDMVSQMMGSLFGILTLWLLYKEMLRGKMRFQQAALAVCFFALALFSKETSAGLCVGVFALFMLMAPKPRSLGQRILWSCVRSIPFAVVGLLYLGLRTHAASNMPSYGTGIYQIHIGTNILKNLALFAFQSILPFSSAFAAYAVYGRSLLPLAGIFLITGLLAAFWIYAIWNSPRRRLILALLFLAVLSLIPAIFLNHVSESYLYNALPYLMVVLGFVIEFYWNEASRKVAVSFAALLLVAFIANAIGSMQKAGALADESARSQVLMPQLYPVVSSLPVNGRLYLVNPVSHAFEYSVFAMKGFEPVMFADPWITYHTRRPDVALFVLDSAGYSDSVRVHPGIAYTMNAATLRIEPY